MSANNDKHFLIKYVTAELKEALQGRGHLSREDLEYVVTAISKLKDQRLKECVTELIGWGDEQRARLETNAAIGLEAMALCSPSRLREAAKRVELRYHLKATGITRHYDRSALSGNLNSR